MVDKITTINISERAFNFANSRPHNWFTAKNRIRIECSDIWASGFENGETNTLYLDKTFIGGRTIFKNFIDRHARFKENESRISEALKELENAAEKYEIEKNSIATINISDRAYKFATEV